MKLLLQAEIFSVTGHGKLRITYNWQYSALNCNAHDNSPFIWNIYQAQNNTIVLSPQIGYAGKTLYASVRDDGDWYLQVQAPHSADWITAAQRDEFIGLQMLDLGLAKMTGFNNQLIGVVSQPEWIINQQGTVTAGVPVYRLRSAYKVAPKETIWYIKTVSGGTGNETSSINVVTRIGVQTPSLDEGLQGVLQQQGVSLSSEELSALISQINS